MIYIYIYIYIIYCINKLDLTLNNLQEVICWKTQPTKPWITHDVWYTIKPRNVIEDFEINRLDFFHSTIERERERKRETESLWNSLFTTESGEAGKNQIDKCYSML